MQRFVTGIAVAGLATVGWAGPQGYASRFQNIRAGVVVLDADRVSGAVPARSAAPFTFYNLDQAAPIKPAGWSFYNPYGPSVLSPELFARYSAINASLPSGVRGPAPVLGDRLTKRNAPYWEVSIGGLSDAQLANYDVLLVAPRYNGSLNPAERNKLRRFVDNGGVLWVDPGALATPLDNINNFPIAFQVIPSPESGGEQTDYANPLVTWPQTLSPREMSVLNAETWSANNWLIAPTSPNPVNTLFSGLVSEYQQLKPVSVVSRGSRATYWSVASAQLGEGFIAVTSRGIAAKLNLPANFGSVDDNASYVAKDLNPGVAATAAAKFAVNLISTGSQYRQAAGSSRKSASTFLSIDAPLLERFHSEAPLAASTRQSPPIVYKGVTIATDGNKLVAFDSNPQADLDNDGNPDDGIQDYGSGKSEDRLWQSVTMSGPISAPVAVEVARPLNGLPSDQVLVVDSSGTLHSFAVFPKDANGRIKPLTAAPELWSESSPTGTADFGGNVPNPPTIHENLAIVGDSFIRGSSRLGRVWVENLRTANPLGGNSPLALGGPSSDVNIGEISSGPTVGYIPIQDNSGGVDRIVYVPTRPSGAGTPNPNLAASVTSIWLGSKGERPVDFDDSTGSLLVTTRAATQGGLTIYLPDPSGPEAEFSPRLTIIDKFGNPMTEGQMLSYFTGLSATTGAGGVLSFPMKSGARLPEGSGVRVDYTINWADTTPGIMTNAIRGIVNVPDKDNNRSIIGSLALTPMGTIYAVVGDGTTGGTLLGFREEGRGAFRCILRYDLFEQHNILLNDSVRTPYREVLADNDPVNAFIPSANADDARLRSFAFRTGPSVRNGQVMVGARAQKFITVPGFGRVPVPVGILMAFRAEPEVAEIPVGDVGNGVTLLQPDMARSSDATQPETQSVFSDSNFTYNPSQGVIRIDNLMSSNRGPMLASLSLSQPIIVRPANGPDKLIDPDALGGRWNPLLWYTTVTGLDIPLGGSGVLTTGNTVFISGESRAPNVLSGLGLNPVGQIYAYDSQISANDPSLISWSVRPWVKQMGQIINTGDGITGNAHVRWPQLKGISGVEDYVIRLNQTVLAGSSTSYGVVGGEGSLISWGDTGLYSFNRSDFAVCDQNRFGIYDASGNVSFTSDAIATLGGNGTQAATAVRPITRPVKSYSLGSGESLVVDPGSNRVIRIDSASREVRSITEFSIDSSYVPTGFEANESTKLSAPMDASTWAEFAVKSGDGAFTNQAATEWWVHYLIADTGNSRLIELVDRYQVDPATGRILGPVMVGSVPQLGVLAWHSPKSASGPGFSYQSVNRVFVPATGSAPDRFVYVSGVSNAAPNRASVGLDTDPTFDTSSNARSGNGGVVVMDPADPKFVRVVNRFAAPDTSATPFWDASSGTFRSAVAANNPILTARRSGAARPISNLNSVTARVINQGGTPILAVMIAEGTGVYELVMPNDTSDVASAIWMLPNEAYTALRRFGGTGAPSSSNPKQLRATYARRLDNGDVILVNGVVGQRFNGDSFTGEVLELKGDGIDTTSPNLGFGLASIRFEFGPVQGTRGLVQPVFADRR